jgi:hypothetical protein
MVTITSGVERWANDVASGDARETDAAATRVELAYEPFPKQREFHASPAKYRLFGGAAGPGKSKALLMEAILQAHEHAGANTLLLRRTFPELEQSLLLYFRRDVPRELYTSFQESKHVVTWRNGSTTRFGYCQRENDVYQYQGAEFLFIGIDELTLFTLRQWQFLTSRNRCPVPGAFPSMAGATNPGNIGHAWVKALWIDKQPASGMENPAEYDSSDYDFIAARVFDNPIYADDENYLKSLRALPTHLKRAFLDGDWDVFAGQYFDKFDFTRHVVRPERIDWKPWWPRWISIDWGFEHPAAVYWHASIPSASVAAATVTENVAQAFRSEGVRAVAETSVRQSGPADVTPSPVNENANQTCFDAGLALRSDGYVEQSAQTGLGEDPSYIPRRSTGDDYRPGQVAPTRVVTYREYVTQRTAPRDLAREIIVRSLLSSAFHSEAERGAAEESLFAWNARSDGTPKRDPSPGISRRIRDDIAEGERAERERIDAIYLSPDAFARRTDEASIAEQMGDIFAAAGLPRPVPADDDRVGGWMLMYQMLDAGEWILTENCVELIRTLPNLVRDTARIEDIAKVDGDDTADAARYGLKSRYAARRGDPDGRRSRMPLADRLAARVLSSDPTIRAMQARKAQIEETSGAKPVSFRHRRH